MAILDKKIDDNQVEADRFRNILSEYRDRVLGKSCVKKSPPEYWVIALVTDLHWTLSHWNSLPILERAKIMARHYLQNMVAVIDAHYRESDESRKRNQEQIEKDRKGSDDG